MEQEGCLRLIGIRMECPGCPKTRKIKDAKLNKKMYRSLNPKNQGNPAGRKVTQRSKDIDQYILDNYPAKRPTQIAKELGITRETVDTRVWRMKQKGIISS